MTAHIGCCVIVDGYSAGNLLPGEFRLRGYSAVHVQSTPVIWPILKLTYRPDDYTHRLSYENDLEPVVQDLALLGPVCVIAGTETGVTLADRLGEALGLASNGSRLSAARRDKYLMIETVRDAGLRVARQFKAREVDEVVAWVSRENLQKVVVKPLQSAGTDSVATCQSRSEITMACHRILGQVNQLGLLNEEVLCQEFLEGTEYALDAVSMGGKTHFTAIWQYHKVAINDAQFVYDRDELVSCTDSLGAALCRYARRVHEALGIVVGPSHTEIMMTPSGPTLVEIGARLNGTTTPELHRRCVGYGQLDLTADAFVDSAQFEKKASRAYELKEFALSVALISQTKRVVKGVPGESLIRQLPSFNDIYLRAKSGYQMRPTVDFYTHPGFVILVHPDRAVLEADLARLRALERSGQLYEFENGCTAFTS